MSVSVKAIHIGQGGQIKVTYGGVEGYSQYIDVGCSRSSVGVRINTDTLRYDGTDKTLAYITHVGSGISAYYLGYKKDSVATSDGQITWMEANVSIIKKTEPGTYYIYCKYIGDSDHCDMTYYRIGEENDGKAVINKAPASAKAVNPDSVEPNANKVKLKIKDYTGNVNFFKETGTWDFETETVVIENGVITCDVNIPGSATSGIYNVSIDVGIHASSDGHYDSGVIHLTWEVCIDREPPIEIYNEDDTSTDNTYPDYVRLDDDVSFQIVRTNPKLTTNTKLMYDGKNMYMEAYHATPILSTIDYKNFKVYSTGLFNKDLRKFLLGTDMAAYTVGQDVRNTIILDSFDNQFENMYWCGVESINSDVYPQEMGCIAPLYLRKKRPNYFVIFKIDAPANTNLNIKSYDNTYDFREDILKKAKIVKSFDLREGTPIGDYIKRYVEQKHFEYDRSIYVNFSANEIYYYGIDKSSGVLTQKVENFEQRLLNNDNTIMKMDDWITSGFERNNLIFPYIINFEFLFDDKETSEYKFARYFGMYCNDIDLYDVDVTNMTYGDGKTIMDVDRKNSDFEITEDTFFYIKDKYNNIFTIEDSTGAGDFVSYTKLNSKDFTGFEPTSVSAYVERIPGKGHSFMVLEVYDNVEDGNSIEISPDGYTITAKESLDAGKYMGSRFSCKGTNKDVATALAGAINKYDSGDFENIRSFSIDNKVVIEAIYSDSNLNGIFDIIFNGTSSQKIRKLTDRFDGGTDSEGYMFKIYTDDKEVFIDSEENARNDSRYLKCEVNGKSSKILSFMPYIKDRKIDDTYSLLLVDENGPKVSISNTNEVEILDRFYPKIGLLSFFPVKDFDFDTVSSAYGNDDMMQQELTSVNKDIEIDAANAQNQEKYMGYYIMDIPYGRFFYNNGSNIDTEYEYFFENIIPELCTVNKTVPYIAKWGYIDDSKDSCENVYRLNTSKIFEACNFSANTFSKNGDILEYTHSMPYYINCLYGNYYDEDNLRNEYQYIPIKSDFWTLSKNNNDYDTIVDAWVAYFEETDKNNFEKLFGDTSMRPLNTNNENLSGTKYFSNKRFNKKYSRFLLGDKVNRSSTLFRGVKFEIEELDNGKEVHTGKFNDYKFSFIYIPICNTETTDESESENNTKNNTENNKYTVHFIKNDKFKFIVGLVLFDIKSSLEHREFNKAYVYAGSMYYIKK